MTQITNGVVTGTANGDAIDLSEYLVSPANMGTSMFSDGKAGNDTIIGTVLNDYMSGGEGDDILDGAGGNNNIHGDEGNDTISASGIVGTYSWLYGDAGDDRITGGDGADALFGGSDRDTIRGGLGNDRIFGDAGDDFLAGDAGRDTLDGGSGNDRFLLSGDYSSATYNQPGGFTTLYAGLVSGEGDIYNGGSGIDLLQANEPNLTLVINDASQLAASSIEGLSSGVASGFRVLVEGAGAHDFTKVRLDSVALHFGTGDDTITGSSAAQMVDADADGQVNDSNGATGNDSLFGGEGTDIVLVAGNRADYFVILLANKTLLVLDANTADGNTGLDILSGIERLEFADQTLDLTPTNWLDADAIGGSQLDGLAGLVNENTSNGASVGIAVRAEPSVLLVGQTVTYSLADDAGGRFAIDGETGVVTVANASLFDYETAPVLKSGPERGYFITILATTLELSSAQTMGVVIADGNEAPDALLDFDPSTANSVVEGAAAGTYTGLTARASDINGDTLTYTLVDDAGGRFVIGTSSGVVTVAASVLLDFESDAAWTVVVRAADATMFIDQSFTITVTDFTGELVADSDLATADQVTEGAQAGSYTGVTASAVSAWGGTMTYALTDDADGRFAINSATGAVNVLDGARLDFESQIAWSITASATDGIATSAATFTIALTDFTGELVVDSDLATADQVIEGAQAGSYTGVTASAVSAWGGTMTYALTDDADGRFTINSATGALNVLDGARLDFESQSAWSITASATDGIATSAATFTIALTDFTGETPLDADISAVNLVALNAPNGTYVGITASAASASGAPISYSLADDSGGGFAIGAVSGLVTVLNTDVLSKITSPSVNITVQASDGSTPSLAQFTIILQDPVAQSWTGTIEADFRAATGTSRWSFIGLDDDDTLIGAIGNDTISGGPGNDVMGGHSGDDRLWGEDGQDIAWGDAGADQLGGHAGDDSLYGGIGNDTIWGDFGNDQLGGNDGDDQLWGGPGQDLVWGDPGHDQLGGHDGDDAVFGGDGNDTLWGDDGADTLGGHFGDDRLWAGLGNDRAWGDAGADQLGGNEGNDSLFGGEGRDTIWGDAGDDQIGGNEDDDNLYGLAGDDTIWGDAGNDTLGGHDGEDRLWAGSGNDIAWGDSGADQLGGHDGADTLFGGTGDDQLWGDAGDDDLLGGAGSDTLDGGTGQDEMDGGADADRFVFFAGHGQDQIIGLEAGGSISDVVALNGFATLSTFAEVQGNMSVVGGNVVLNTGGGSTITFVGIGAPSAFDANDFLFG
ncbi:Cadherin_repeat domain containing protein [Rhabdaerophilaceae bacterium]